MPVILFFAPALAAALLTYVLTPLAARLANRIGAVDLPGERKIHEHPMPRLGGLAMIAGVAGAMVASAWMRHGTPWPLPTHLIAAVAAGLVPIVAISIRDDIAPVRAMPKFLVHLLGAVLTVALGVSLNSEVHLFGYTVSIGPLAAPLSVVWLMGTTSAFNIVDGLDGLAAGLAFISACALSSIFLVAHQTTMAAMALTVAGGVAGFLPYNMFPARTFFGDTGATAIGFCLGAFALRGGATLSAGFATLGPVFVLGLPIAETFISMARRLVRRVEQGSGGVFDADRNHMHHRLLALGIDHPHAVRILYAIGAMLAAATLVSMFLSARESAMLIVALVMAGALGVRRLGYDEFAVIRRGVVLKAYEAPVLNRSMFVVLVDILIVAAAAVIAVTLKADGQLAENPSIAIGLASLLAPITIVVFWRMGVYRQSWRLAGADEFSRACTGVLISTLLGATVRTALVMRDPSISLLVVFATVHLVLLIGCRASYQLFAAGSWRSAHRGAPVLIYGAGRRGLTALSELTASVESQWRPVAFVDDDPAKAGTVVRGLPVAGSLATLERTLSRLSIRAIVVAADSLSQARLAQLDALCSRAAVALLQLRVTLDEIAGAPALVPETVPATHAVARPVQRIAESSAPHFADAPLRTPRPAIAAPDHCPLCASGRLRRSHVRRVSERVRKHFTQKRLFRCDDCGWRGWVSGSDLVIFEPSNLAPTLPSLERVDRVLRAQPMSLRAS